MKKFFIILIVLCSVSCTTKNRAEALIGDIFNCIAWVEDDEGETVYYCGARWTGPYGVTINEHNKLFKKGDKVSKRRAKKLVYKHLRTQVFPFLPYVERHLKDREIIAVCLFIYNVGGETFSGHRLNGTVSGKPSQFLQAINRGDNPEDIVNKMTIYRRSAGKRANGLLKRHWVVGAIYLGEIPIKDVPKFRPKSFYETKNFGNYYWLDSNRRFTKNEQGYYYLRYDKTTVKTFYRMNKAKKRQRSVRSIV